MRRRSSSRRPSRRPCRPSGTATDVTVVAGGTIVVPDITHGRVRPRRALLLGRAGLAGQRRRAGRTTIGAMTTGGRAGGRARPAREHGPPRRRRRDPRARPRSAGTCCAPPGAESPRGDLQAALIALGARGPLARAPTASARRPVEDFLAAAPCSRLALEVSFADPEAGATATVRRPHAHAYTVLAVCAARVGGEVRLGVSAPARGRCAPRGRGGLRGLPATPQAAAARGPGRRRRPWTMRSRRAGTGARRFRCSCAAPSPDRAEGGCHMRLTVNGGEHDVHVPAAHDAARRPARGAVHHEPEGRLPAGRLRRLHGPRRRRAAPRLPDAGRRDRRRDGRDGRGPRHARRPLARPGRLPRALRRRSAASAPPAS